TCEKAQDSRTRCDIQDDVPRGHDLSDRARQCIDALSISKKLAMLVELNRHSRSPLLTSAAHRQTIIMPPPPPSPTDPVEERVNLATLPYSVRAGFSYGFLTRRGDRSSFSCEAPSIFFSTGPPMVSANEWMLVYRRPPTVPDVARSVRTAHSRYTRQEKSSRAGPRAFYSACWRRRTDRASRRTSS